MNAIKTKYDKPYKKKDFLLIAIVPALYVAFMLYITFYIPFPSLIGAVVGAFYSLAVALPKKIKVDYERRSLKMRNRFMGNLAQAINRKNATVLDVLKEMADHRLNGELQTQIEELIYKINNASPRQKQEAYQELMDVYKHDTIFVHYLEHLLTLDLQGKVDTTALDETVELHNNLVDRHQRFIDEKAIKVLYYVLNIALGVVLIFLFQWLARTLITHEGYLNYFAHSLIGILFNLLFLIMTFYFNHKCVIAFVDESLLEGRL